MGTSVFRFSLALLLLLGVATGTQAQSTGPGKAASSSADKVSVEVDFWRSVERMDTADAYAAYLETYPNGRFAPLAKVAIRRLSVATPVLSPSATVPAAVTPVSPAGQASTRSQPLVQVATPAPGRPGNGTLKVYKEMASSGSIDLAVGDRIVGPGVITLGRIGAKKQFPVPAGEWLMLAATDHDSEPQPKFGPIGGSIQINDWRHKMVTVTLAQFDGTQVRSLIIATLNRLPGDNINYRWTDVEECEAKDLAASYRDRQTKFPLKSCMHVRQMENRAARDVVASPHWKEMDIALLKLGATMGAFNTESTFFVVDHRTHYLRVVRLDCTAVQGGQPVCERPVGLDAVIAWSKNYGPMTQAAFDRRLSLPELEAIEDSATP